MLAALATALSDRLLGWRDRLLVDPAFHRRIVRLPFGRSVARRRARELFDLVSGFVYSQTLLACVRLRLFDALADGPQSTAALATHMQLTEDRAQRLLGAACAVRLIERRGPDRYGLGVLGGALVANPGIVAMVEHHALFYRDLVDPVGLLRGTGTPTDMSRYWAYCSASTPGALAPDAVAAYSALMAASQPLVADEILDAYRFAAHRSAMDVGGGEGGFLAAVAARAPRLDLTLVDLPPVVERARARFARAGLADRVQIHGADFLTDPLPEGRDLVSLVRVIHDHDDAVVMRLLHRIRAAIAPGGTLIVAEPMAETGASVPVGDAYFAFYLLAMGTGRNRTVDEVAAMLTAAGFSDVRRLGGRRPVQVRVLRARAA